MAVEINWNTPNKNDKVAKAVVYARFSSHRQGEQSIEGQLAEAHRYAAAHGYTIVHEYVDRAKSGRTDNREEFQKMLKDTAKRQFNVIILWKIDRFGRNREEIALNPYRCRKTGVRVEYLAESIPNTPEGVILESVLEGFAEYYSLQLAQNIRRGIAVSADKCQVTGGARPLGYKTGADKKFEIDEATAPTVKLIFSMYADGVPLTQIVKKLNEQGLRTAKGKPFTNNSLHTILKNEKYIGIYNNAGRRVVGGVPRIIDDELWKKVQEMLKVNKRAPAKTWARTDYLLSDKLFCGKCGALMFGESGTSKNGTRHNYYICSNKKRFKTCDKKAARQADIEDLVIKATLQLLEDEELLEFIIENTWQYYLAQDDSQEEVKHLQSQLQQTETAIGNLIRAMEAGIITDETKARMDELTAQKAALKTAISEREFTKVFRLQKEHISFYLNELKNADHKYKEVQKQMVKTFINSVFVFDDHLKISYNYSGDNSIATLQMLKDAEAGNVFGRYAELSTI